MKFTSQGSYPTKTPMSILSKPVFQVMQLSAFLLLTVYLHVSAAPIAQSVISFSGKNVPLNAVFDVIKKQTGYGIFFENSKALTIASSTLVTLDLKNAPVEAALQMCFRDSTSKYYSEVNTIFINTALTPETMVHITDAGGVAVYGFRSATGIIFVMIKEATEPHFSVKMATLIKYLCEIIHFLLHNPCISPKKRRAKTDSQPG